MQLVHFPRIVFLARNLSGEMIDFGDAVNGPRYILGVGD